MVDDTGIAELSDEEKKIKNDWNRLAFIIKRDLANVWTDEARKYFSDLEQETERVAFVFRRLHSHYESNTKDQYTGYNYEMIHLRQFIKDVRKIPKTRAVLLVSFQSKTPAPRARRTS